VLRRTFPAVLMLAFLPALAGAQAPAGIDNKAIARRYFEEILNKGSAPAIDAIVAADVVFRNPPAVVKGIADFRKLVAGLRGAFPDLHFILEDELAEGNKVATRWVMRGTQGTRKMDVSGMDIFLIENGKIREIWVNMDTLAQARQMGTVAGP
jgi:predicted ester cyclase